MKKNVILIIMLSLLIIYAPKVYADTITKTGLVVSQKEYNNLLNLGFSKEEIDQMSKEVFDENKNIEATLIATDTKYYKSTFKKNSKKRNEEYTFISTEEITKLEYENEINNDKLRSSDEIVNTEYKKMTLSLSFISSSKQYRVKNVLTWKKMPSTRSYDIIAIGNNNSVSEPIANTYHADITYSTYDTCLTTNYSNYKTDGFTWTKSSQGAGATFTLPKNSSKEYNWNELLGIEYPCVDTSHKLGPNGTYNAPLNITGITTTMYFNLSKVSKAALNAYGSYRHSKKSISISPSFSIVPGGSPSISLNASLSSKYDSMSDTHITILNPKW